MFALESQAVSTSRTKFDRSVSCLCWAYNEKLLIRPFLMRLNSLLKENIEEYEIVVVDDGSTDGTGDIVQELQEVIPQIVLVRNRINMNVGASFQRAVQTANKEFLFWQTIDWSYELKNIRSHLELLRTYDVVAGSRCTAMIRSESWTGHVAQLIKMWSPAHLKRRSDTLPKALVSAINYTLIRLLFRVPLTDFQNVVLYSTKLIQSFRFESESSFSNPEGLLKAYWSGARIVEVPIAFIPRMVGEAKGTRPKAILKAVGNLARLWVRWMVLRNRDFKHRGTVFRL